MSDPIGTAGARPQAEGDPDLHAIYRGGEFFMQRMKKLSDMREAQEASYERLRIGSDARTAYDEANSLKADAVAKCDQAAKVLADSQAQAAKTIGEANANADRVVVQANAAAKKTNAEAAKVKADADSYAATTRDQASRVLADADEIKKQVAVKLADAERALQNRNAAAAAAAAAQAAAEKTKTELQAKITQLNAALRNIA